MLKEIFHSQTKTITFAALLLGTSALLSRILGLVRNGLLAGHFGAGVETDIYFAAFRIPDLVYNLLIAGGLTVAFLPLFSEYYLKDKKKAWEMVNCILNVFLFLLILLSLVLFIFAPWLIKFITPGFSLAERDLTVALTRLMFLSPIFFGLASIFSGVLHYFNRFLAFSLAPILYNIGIIFGILVLAPVFGIFGVGLGVILGALFYLLIQIPSAIHCGFQYRFIFDFKLPALKRIFYLMLPRTFAIAAQQINLIVITAIASTLTVGSISVFTYANDFYYLPIGIVAIPFAVAAFPVLSRDWSNGKIEKFKESFSAVFRQILFLAIPTSVLLFLLRAQVVRLILGSLGTNFDWRATKLTAACLGLFSLGIFAAALIPLISRAFFSFQDTKTPTFIAIGAVCLNVVLSFSFVWLLQIPNQFQDFLINILKLEGMKDISVIGLPLAFSFGVIFQFLFLLFFLRRKIGDFKLREIWLCFQKVILATALMGVGCYFTLHLVADFTNTRTVLGLLFQAVSAGVVAVFCYIVVAFLLRSAELKIIYLAVKKQFSKIMSQINLLRNFSIISHIDHGKSTLADRFLELTHTVEKRKMRTQFLDMMDLEREKGITIKMQPVRMDCVLNTKPYILNLIDTPGHADFSYEVSRSLAAVEGAILLVDAAKGIQAQTLANLDLARKQNLVIIPVVNKIDLPLARTEEVKHELAQLLNISESEILAISAKQGINISGALEAAVERIPCPKGDTEKPFQALIFDSKYDSYKGVIAYVRVMNGELKRAQKINLLASKEIGEVKELGYFKPELSPQEKLNAGEIGYIATGIKEPGKVRIGDTITLASPNIKIEALPGYREPQPNVFTSLYPHQAADYDLLKQGLAELKLNDPALVFESVSKEALGRGFRCGFLGSLHTEISIERLSREFDLDLVVSSPSAVSKIIKKNDAEQLIFSPADWPDPTYIKETQELWARLEVLTPNPYLGQVLKLLESAEGKHMETSIFGKDRFLLIYEVPLRKIIVGFYDNLKGVSQGYASMSYEILDYRKADLVKLEILIAGEKEEAFSSIVSRKQAELEARRMLKKLKEVLPAQQFSLTLQAVLGGKIVARETKSARRKDVIAPLYGGDYTRKRKLLEKQKKGKKRLKEGAKLKIPASVFLEMFQR